MKIVIFGLGSIGQRHARLLKDNFKHELYAFRTGTAQNELGLPEIRSMEELDRIKPDVGFITNPTDKHIEYALACGQRGMHMFIEKPLSHTYEGVEKLAAIIRERHIITQIGYDLRFHPAIAWLKGYLKQHKSIHTTVNASSYLPDWRKGVNHLKHYSAFKARGGGIILELSHEIDYLHYLLGEVKQLKVQAAKRGKVTADAEDFADILLQFKNGTYANLHMNFFSRLLRREIILDFDDCTIIADLVGNRLIELRGSRQGITRQAITEFNIQRDDLYISELKQFFSRIRNKEKDSFEESMNVLKLVLSVSEEALK